VIEVVAVAKLYCKILYSASSTIPLVGVPAVIIVFIGVAGGVFKTK